MTPTSDPLDPLARVPNVSMMMGMKVMRYRRPSLNQVLGITAAKRRARRAVGISQVEAWTKPSRVKQRAKSQLGLYSPTARIMRQTARGKVPSPLGLWSRKPK